MSVRVGHIMRHEDVHGVSGTGRVADVFEASNGKCIVVWISASSSVNVYDNVKAVENTHSHGGKSEIIWDWEAPPDPDPMGSAPKKDAADLTDDEVVEIAAKTAERVVETATGMVAEKLAERAAATKKDNGSEPEKEDKPSTKKKATRKKSPTKKKT